MGKRFTGSYKGRKISLTSHTRPIQGVKFNKEADLIFTYAKDGFCTLWRSENGERLGTYKHNGAVYDCSICKNTEYLLTACADGYFYIWQALTGVLIRKETYEMEFSSIGGIGRCVSCEFSPSGNKFLINWFGKDRNHLAVYKFDQFEIDSECELKPYQIVPIFEEALNHKERLLSDRYPTLSARYPTSSIIKGGRANAIWGIDDTFILASCENGMLERWQIYPTDTLRAVESALSNELVANIIVDFLKVPTKTHSANAKDPILNSVWSSTKSVHDNRSSSRRKNIMPIFSKKDNFAVSSMVYNKNKTAFAIPCKGSVLIYSTSLQLLRTIDCHKELPQVNAAVFVPGLDLLVCVGGIPEREVTTTKFKGKNPFKTVFYHVPTKEKMGHLVLGNISPQNCVDVHVDMIAGELTLVTGSEEGNCRIYNFLPTFLTKCKSLYSSPLDKALSNYQVGG